MSKLAVFDFDSTLMDGETIDFLAAPLGLEEAVAQTQEHQAEGEKGHAPDTQAEISCGHQDATEEDRPPESQQPVGDHSPEEGREIDEGQVGPVDFAGGGVGHAQPATLGVDDVEVEDAHHQVESKSLPHLGKEEGVQTLGVLLRHSFEPPEKFAATPGRGS